MSGAGDFDFLVGSWDVANRRLPKPLSAEMRSRPASSAQARQSHPGNARLAAILNGYERSLVATSGTRPGRPGGVGRGGHLVRTRSRATGPPAPCGVCGRNPAARAPLTPADARSDAHAGRPVAVAQCPGAAPARTAWRCRTAACGRNLRSRPAHGPRRRTGQQRHRRGADRAARVDVHARVSPTPGRCRSLGRPAGIGLVRPGWHDAGLAGRVRDLARSWIRWRTRARATTGGGPRRRPGLQAEHGERRSEARQ
jgi:hypothetical protein